MLIGIMWTRPSCAIALLSGTPIIVIIFSRCMSALPSVAQVIARKRPKWRRMEGAL